MHTHTHTHSNSCASKCAPVDHSDDANDSDENRFRRHRPYQSLDGIRENAPKDNCVVAVHGSHARLLLFLEDICCCLLSCLSGTVRIFSFFSSIFLAKNSSFLLWKKEAIQADWLPGVSTEMNGRNDIRAVMNDGRIDSVAPFRAISPIITFCVASFGLLHNHRRPRTYPKGTQTPGQANSSIIPKQPGKKAQATNRTTVYGAVR